MVRLGKKLGILALLGLLPVTASAHCSHQSFDIRYTTHGASPIAQEALAAAQCGRLALHANQPSFQQLVNQDRQRLQGFWVERVTTGKYQGRLKCHEHYRAIFSKADDYYAFVKKLSLPDYSFAGIDFEIYNQAIQQAVKNSDAHLYRHFLTRDLRASASEELRPLFAQLRENPATFIRTYNLLSNEQKTVAVAQQFDFNIPLTEHLIVAKGVDARAWNKAVSTFYQQANITE